MIAPDARVGKGLVGVPFRNSGFGKCDIFAQGNGRYLTGSSMES